MAKKGFGTNFHKIYKEKAGLYHAFSSAEFFTSDLKKKIDSLLSGKTLLDIACGTCHKTNNYSKYFDKVYALDKSAILLNYAREKCQNNKKFNYILSDASKIPLLDESVDTILITWGSFPLTRTIKEMKRVLKKNGRIIRIGAIGLDEFTALFPAFSLRRINTINNTFRKHGFAIDEYAVSIRFNSLGSAKKVLSMITGANPEKITTQNFTHRTALCYYIKL